MAKCCSSFVGHKRATSPALYTHERVPAANCALASDAWGDTGRHPITKFDAGLLHKVRAKLHSNQITHSQKLRELGDAVAADFSLLPPSALNQTELPTPLTNIIAANAPQSDARNIKYPTANFWPLARGPASNPSFRYRSIGAKLEQPGHIDLLSMQLLIMTRA